MITIKNEFGRAYYEALLSQYKAEITKASAALTLYLNNPVAIGEHSDLQADLDLWVTKLTDAVGKYDTLRNMVDADNDGQAEAIQGETDEIIKG